MIDIQSYLKVAGERLPPERELAKEWGVSRNEVRKILGRLEMEGHLERKVGSGTYVKPRSVDALPDVTALCQATSPREAMEARMVVEPETARLAAINATGEHIASMRSLAAEMRKVRSWPSYKDADKQLHELVAHASGNKLLAMLQRIVHEVRSKVVWDNLDTASAGPAQDYSSFAEHDAIIDAIARRDREGAADAMSRHLKTTYSRLIG